MEIWFGIKFMFSRISLRIPFPICYSLQIFAIHFLPRSYYLFLSSVVCLLVSSMYFVSLVLFRAYHLSSNNRQTKYCCREAHRRMCGEYTGDKVTSHDLYGFDTATDCGHGDIIETRKNSCDTTIVWDKLLGIHTRTFLRTLHRKHWGERARTPLTCDFMRDRANGTHSTWLRSNVANVIHDQAYSRSTWDFRRRFASSPWHNV